MFNILKYICFNFQNLIHEGLAALAGGGPVNLGAAWAAANGLEVAGVAEGGKIPAAKSKQKKLLLKM